MGPRDIAMRLNRWQRAWVFLSVLFVYNERGGLPPGHSWLGEIAGFVVPIVMVYAIVSGIRWVIFDSTIDNRQSAID